MSLFRRILLFLATAIFAGVVWKMCQEKPLSINNNIRADGKVSYNFDIRPILSDKCFACHGPDANKREAGLRLDDAESAYKSLAENPGAHAIVPGKPELSVAYQLISSTDTTMMMPPASSNLKLTQHEIELIKKWISQGAKYEKHWSFLPPEKTPIPQVSNKKWPKNEIDYFTIEQMESHGLQPNGQADKDRLLKRLAFDLTGLPPSLELMEQFQDPEQDYEKIVDLLLANPAYGEKMAVHWLDIARYADSYGYQDDGYRTQWPWRDWVIHAFNKNQSYKDFVTWQLAGDLLPNATLEQKLATGFNRNHKITEEGGVIPEEYRVSYVADRSDLFGKAFLGITMECARCHDHKYDPVSQKDYYSLFAFFNNVNEKGIESVIGGPETYAKSPLMEISRRDIDSVLSFINQTDTNRLIVSVMGDLPEPRKTFLLNRGEYDSPGAEVEAATPEAILKFKGNYPKNRLGLSQWLFDKEHPLTARVYVNILWQEFFGTGLVKTTGDFGMQGELPSHPALLDWLAVDFMENNWDIKRLIKKMVMSATYRQSSVIDQEKFNKDPENKWLARGVRYRVNAEFVRDIVLSSSGLLNKSIGGPSVKPYQPEGLWEGATSGRGLLSIYKQDKGSRLYRRGVYTLIKRTVPPPSMAIFDASNRDICEVKRLKTNTPLQALVMMNDPTVLEASRVLAGKLLIENNDIEQRINKAFRLIVCRQPRPEELNILLDYYQEEVKKLDIKTAERAISVGEYPNDKNLNKVEQAALMRVITTLYNLEETITKT
jgi:hypothetical protein